MEIKTAAIAEQFLILDYAETKFLNFCHEVGEAGPSIEQSFEIQEKVND